MQRESERVIADETKDVYQAMHLSDALISEYSSLLVQYIAMKKPVYIIDIHKSDRENVMIAYDCYDSCLLEDMPVKEFIKMVMCGKNPTKNIRYKTMADSVVNVDGTAGEKVFYHK